MDPDDSSLDGHHLSVVPMDGGRDLVLDEMLMWGGDRPDGPPTYQTPAFMFDTDDVHAAHTFAREYGADVVTDLQEFDQQGWFAFRDPDGNLLMVCGANPSTSGPPTGSQPQQDGSGVRLLDSGAIHAVGLVATCTEDELSVVVPRLWDLLGTRLGDVARRVQPDRQVSVFLGRRGDIFTEFVGVVVPDDAPTPDGMIRIDVPAATYAAIHHVGQDVQGSYRRVFDWAEQHGHGLPPHERAHHHLEWYREPVLQGELDFDIWVRVQPQIDGDR